MSNTFKIGETEYLVKTPSLKVETEAQKMYNKQIQAGVLNENLFLKEQMPKFLQERGLWDSEKEMQISTKREEIDRKLVQLQKGGMKISEALGLAKEIAGLRFDIFALSSYKNQYNYLTAEHHAEATKFAYILSQCLVYNESGKRVYETYEQLLDSNNKELFDKASEVMSDILYGKISEYIDDLPESKFLAKYKKYDTVVEEVQTTVEEPKYLDDEGNPIE